MLPEPSEPRRSVMFYASDVAGAAETMAYELAEHGLTEEQTVALAEALENAAHAYFVNEVIR